jgi:hypothetical protein
MTARGQALASSIALFLGTMSDSELEQVDDCVMRILAEREAWVRREGRSVWCAVADVASGAVATLCDERFAVTDEHDTESRPPRAERCETCQRAFVEREIARLAGGCTCRAADVSCPLHVSDPVTAGLRELARNAPSTRFGDVIEQLAFDKAFRREFARRGTRITLIGGDA